MDVLTRYLEDKMKLDVDTLKISSETGRSLSPGSSRTKATSHELRQLEEKISKRMAESIE